MLKTLSSAFGPSGCEDEVRKILSDFMSNYCDEVYEDKMGNLICHQKGKLIGGKSIMLSAHMDEVGFIISHITEDGYLKFQTVGGIDPNVLISKRVVIGENKVGGVIGTAPAHHQKEAKNVSESDLYIDIGATSREDAKRYIEIGDYACFDSGFVLFGDNMVKSKALDDRIGCYILTEIAKVQKELDIYYTFVVQEEVGCRGAKITAKAINPIFAIVLEGTTCSDVPGTDEFGFSTHLKCGPALSMRDGGAYADIGLTNEIINVAKKRNIKWQYKQTTKGGNDSSSIQVSGGGYKVASVSVPCRYIHSQSNVASLEDIENTIALIKAFLESKVIIND